MKIRKRTFYAEDVTGVSTTRHGTFGGTDNYVIERIVVDITDTTNGATHARQFWASDDTEELADITEAISMTSNLGHATACL